MNLEPYIKQLLDGGMKSAEQIVKFIENEAPQLMHEYIVWGSVSEITAPLVGLLFASFAVVFHIVFSKKWGDDGYYNSKEVPGAVISIVCFVFGAAFFACEIMDVLYPIIAPRVFLLDKIKELI